MIFQNKNRFKPVYKRIINLRDNIQNRKKVLKFKKLKWSKFIEFYKKKLRWYKKFRPQNQTKYLVTKYPNRYGSYTQRYKRTHQSYKVFNFFYGNLKRKIIKNKIFIIKKEKTKKKTLKFLELFEKRLDVVLYRAKFSSSLRNAQQLITHKKVSVNNKIIKSKSYLLKQGDLISINLKYSELIEFNFSQSELWPIPPKHLIINYKIMQIIFNNINHTNLSTLFSFPLNLEKILINFPRH